MPSNYVLLRKTTLTATATSVTFSSIPQTGYTDLKLVMATRDARTGVDVSDILFNFNGAGVGSGISGRYLYGTGTNALTSVTTDALAFGGSAANTANTFGNSEVYISNYLSTNTYKSISSDSVSENNAAGAVQLILAGLWSSNSAIHTIAMTPYSSPFQIGSEFSLYGLAAVGTTPEIAPFASGGDIVANDGTYWYHAFLSSGKFTPAKELTCDVLRIGGGGGGAGNFGGGGGAGGLLYTSGTSLTALSNHPVLVGAGGGDITVGNNSEFGSLTVAIGGGAGGGGTNTGGGPQTQQAGGNGGGGGGNNGAVNQNTTVGGVGSQGFNGGTGKYDRYGGGGAGAGGAGSNAAGSNSGNGGVGVNTYSAWASATGTGASGFYAGGGGGGAYFSTAGTGSNGGGNGGIVSNDGTAATAFTGSGGGGGGGNNSGGAGASGIVIVRYLMV